jgi:hypothetical protein
MVALMHGSGIRIERITRLVSELNRRLFARLWALVAPADLVAHSCLLVMGSEGRGEQILKTDQDNALLLRDGFDVPGPGRPGLRFNAALAELGYPPCPGGIMLTNAAVARSRWRRFRDTLRGWVHGARPARPDAPGDLLRRRRGGRRRRIGDDQIHQPESRGESLGFSTSCEAEQFLKSMQQHMASNRTFFRIPLISSLQHVWLTRG